MLFHHPEAVEEDGEKPGSLSSSSSAEELKRVFSKDNILSEPPSPPRCHSIETMTASTSVLTNVICQGSGISTAAVDGDDSDQELF